MAEDESLQSVETEERPQTARKDSRKLPGGFDRDDVDDLSPNKATHEDPLLSHVEGSAHNLQKPSFDPAGLPQLPPPGDSSLLYHESNDGKSEVHVDDSAMERHLNDVESSFMPVASPIGLPRHRGADDSYQFDRGATQTRTDSQPSKEEEVITELDNSLPPMSPPTPANAYKTPAPGVEHSSSVGDTTSSLETLSSSPTAAAAARTVSRAISNASAGYNWNDSTSNDNHEQYDSENEAREELDATPRKRKVATIDDSFGSNSLHRQLSNQSLNQYDAGSTPGAALFGNRSSGTRPKFLRSRHSKHSSVSSFITNPESQDGSEATLGADYALQSGGALPAGGLSRNSSMGLGLSRSISLGSMASAIDEDRGDYSGKADGTLETLTEEEQNRRAADASLPSTPRATSRSFVAAAAPTDTIIARHVRNVQVPESLAKEYRNKSGAVTPKIGSSFATSTLGRNGKNLTLKEQSSTIERLSKENFDLKLKVMFLSDRLDKLSEEGVREMISENVELKTGLAVMQRDNKALKRKVKELEKQLKDDEERPSTAISGTSASESPKWFDQEGAQEREEELVYLRERVEEYVTEIEKLRSDSIARENEKRNLAEVVRNMGERRSQNLDAREEMDVWKDLLEQETSRREQTDEDNKRLREEIFRLKTEPGTNGLNHTTNIYNITKKRQISPSRPISGHSNHIDDRTSSAASTLVDELRKETEQLRHENAELRREVGAQTNMLTSRNREKERLYQEIEDLKLGQRRNGGSIAGDSIFERSASRAHQRSLSRTSAGTRQSLMTDTEREELENKNSGLRDSINALKIQNQDLQRELESCMEDFETAVAQKKEAEKLASEMQEALEVAETDLLTMQADRDEALQGQEEAEIMFESLRKEAQEELDGFAAEAEEANVEIERLQTELQDTTENFNALQNEMREMSEALVRLEDDHETKARRIEDLERDLEGANQELEQMEQNLVESNGKVDRFSVQQESAQGEIAFLREEQDGDKIKIGDLEAALKNAERSLQEEGQRAKDLDQRLGNERHQRELIASKEKQEIQQYVNNLNREITNAQDEARRLRKNLQSRETEAAEWKSRLTDLENNLREALGDLNGTRSSMFTSIAKLQSEVEASSRELSTTRHSLTEKERLIKHRDSLLESHGLESRKLADMLDKERQAHRNTKHQFETFQKTQQHTTRTLSQQESRVLELETARQNDRRKMVTMENTFKDQMTERNNLLLQLWNRLSALCGTDWAHNNSLINGRALPSLEAVTNMLPGFSKNLLNAIKTLENLISDFKSRIRTVEKDLWKEYHILEGNLEVRTKRLDRLETLTRSGIPGVSQDGRAEIAKLKDVNRLLKSEISTLRSANDVLRGIHDASSPAPSIPTGPRHKSTDRSSRNSTLTRHHSTSAVETFERVVSRSGSSSLHKTSDNASNHSHPQPSQLPVPTTSSGNGSSNNGSGNVVEFPDLKWQARLKELEYKLKAEREARMIDREGARRRLEEASRENEALSREVERNKVRASG